MIRILYLHARPPRLAIDDMVAMFDKGQIDTVRTTTATVVTRGGIQITACSVNDHTSEHQFAGLRFDMVIVGACLDNVMRVASDSRSMELRETIYHIKLRVLR